MNGKRLNSVDFLNLAELPSCQTTIGIYGAPEFMVFTHLCRRSLNDKFGVLDLMSITGVSKVKSCFKRSSKVQFCS